jgi:hypothetical protein
MGAMFFSLFVGLVVNLDARAESEGIELYDKVSPFGGDTKLICGLSLSYSF